MHAPDAPTMAAIHVLAQSPGTPGLPAPLVAAGLVVGAFLVGSIPFGFLVARARGVDIRRHGSGNIGATNVGRVLGRRWGFLCFGLDFLKGLTPTLAAGFVLARWESGAGGLGPDARTAAWLCVAVGAVLGHMFTPWLGFKGGKGVATGFGALVGVFPVFTAAVLAAFASWLVVLAATRMVGIASAAAGILVAAVVAGLWLMPAGGPAWLEGLRSSGVHAGFAAALAALVVFKHRGNLRRALAGTEPRVGERKAGGAAAAAHGGGGGAGGAGGVVSPADRR